MLHEVTDFCRLILLRHPELDPAHANVAVGQSAAELSRRGRQRALEWGTLLADEEISVLFSADSPQCQQPAEVLAQQKELDLQLEPRLRDQHMGTWEGRSWDELVAEDSEAVKRFFEQFAEVVPPDGESLGQAIERILTWWNEQAPEGAGKTLAVVAPGSLISGFASAMLGMRLSRCLSLNLPHGGIGVIDVYSNGVKLTGWNLDGHSR